MHRRLGFCSLLLVLLLYGVLSAVPQQEPEELNVRITNGPHIESVTGDSAVIAWSTNVNASTVLRYGTSPAQLSLTAETPWGGLTHRVDLQGLQPNTTYYYDVESAQGQGTGTSALSKLNQFKTANSTVAVPVQR